MKVRPCRVLILDVDQDTLIRLEKTLEDAGFDTTSTWDAAEGRHLLASNYFDLLVVGDHPPEVDAGAILGDLRGQRNPCACFILESTIRPSDLERFRSLGAICVVSRWDHPSLLEQVRKHSCPVVLAVTEGPHNLSRAGSNPGAVSDAPVTRRKVG